MVGVSEDAFEIAQESFARTWEASERLMTREDPVFFTLRVAANLSRSHLRRVITLRRLSAFLRPGEPVDPAEDPSTALSVRGAMAALPPRQRWATVLCDMLGYRSDQAASILGIKPSTLRVHLARARAALRDALSDSPDQTVNRSTDSKEGAGGDPCG